MVRQINDWINRVSKSTDIWGKVEWHFLGDGNGDFEQWSTRATKEVLEKYLVDLEEQRKLTLEAIKELYGENKS